MLSPCRLPFKQPASQPSGRAAFLVVMLAGLVTPPLMADEIFQPGSWKGEYKPANLGHGIDATFCIQTDNTSKPPWKITMQLDLPPPGNEPVEFENLESEDESLQFRIDLLGALRECSLENKDKDELSFKCKIADDNSDNNEGILIQLDVPSPIDICQP